MLPYGAQQGKDKAHSLSWVISPRGWAGGGARARAVSPAGCQAPAAATTREKLVPSELCILDGEDLYGKARQNVTLANFYIDFVLKCYF